MEPGQRGVNSGAESQPQAQTESKIEAIVLFSGLNLENLLVSSPGWNIWEVLCVCIGGGDRASEWLLSPIPDWYLVLVIKGSTRCIKAPLPSTGTSWPFSGITPLLQCSLCSPQGSVCFYLAYSFRNTVQDLDEGFEEEHALSLSLRGPRDT